jgi:hypothetical protein
MPLYGVVASFTPPPPPLPEAYAIADFVNGVYSYNGTPIALSAVITDHVPTSITARGLHLVAGQIKIPFVANFYTALFSFNWTLLFELDIDANNNSHVILSVGSETPSFGYTNEIIIQNFGDWEFEDHNGDYPGTPPGTGNSVDRFIDDSTHGLTGANSVHRLGITRTNGFCSLSIDGSPVVTASTPTFSINAPAVGSTDVGAVTGALRYDNIIPQSFYIRKLQIFVPVSNAALVRLANVSDIKIVIVPPARSLTLTREFPSAVVGAFSPILTPTTKALSLSGPAPTRLITIGSPNLVPTVGSLALTKPTPIRVITAFSPILVPAVRSLALAGTTSSKVTDNLKSPTVRALSLTGNTPIRTP